MPGEIPKIQLEDPAANRWQELARTVINDIVKNGLPVPVFSDTSAPTASDTWAGKFIRVRDNRQAEKLQTCLRNSNGTYSWVVVATSQS